MKLNILIPMAGESTFSISENNLFPKILTDVNGKLLIERSSESFISLNYEKKIVVAVPKKQISTYKLDKVLELLDESVEVCPINEKTQGAVCSAMLAIEHLDLDEPLIISSLEQVLDIDLNPLINEFFMKTVDAGVLTFESIHPKWSFVKTDNHGYVIQAAEKFPISHHAIAGLYFFKTARIFIEAAKNMIRNDVLCDGLFYTSHTLNEVILNKGKVLALPIEKSHYCHIHDEYSLENYVEKLISEKSNINETIYALTLDYIEAFNEKSIDRIQRLFGNELKTNSPFLITNKKEEAIVYLKELFANNSHLIFKDRTILIDRQQSVIEFELTLGSKVYIGTDIIIWNNQKKIICINTYINEKSR